MYTNHPRVRTCILIILGGAYNYNVNTTYPFTPCCALNAEIHVVALSYAS